MRELAYHLAGAFERGEISELTHMPTQIGHYYEFTLDQRKGAKVMDVIRQMQSRRGDIDWEISSNGNHVTITTLPAKKYREASAPRNRTFGQAITELGIKRRFIQALHQRESGGDPAWEIHIPVGDYAKVRASIRGMARRRNLQIELQKGNLMMNDSVRTLWVVRRSR